VAGAGLKWRLVRRANGSSGDSEIWTATAPTILARARVSSRLSSAGYDQSLSVIAMEGVRGAGSSAGASGASGTAAVDLTTREPTSLVFAVGNESDHTTRRSFPLGWVPLDQRLDGGTGDTFWSQYTNQPVYRAGTVVPAHVANSTGGAWNLAAIELVGDTD
jgi:hypothetical protein